MQVLFKYIYLVCYLKFCFYCLTCSAMSNINSADFTTPNSHQDFNFQKRNTAWISKYDRCWNYWVLINDFGFTLDSSAIDLWNIDLLDTYTFRFVDSYIPHFFVSKNSWRCLQGMSWRCLEDVLKKCLEDVFNTSLA